MSRLITALKTFFKIIVLLVYFLPTANVVWGQNVDISISGVNTEFNFNTIAKLRNGIVIPNVSTVNIEATTNWDLYVGSVTTVAGTWDNVQYYANSGIASIPVSILQMRVHNLSSTPQLSGFVAMQDIATSTLDIIGNHNAIDTPVGCSDVIHIGTNTPGSYTVDPQCYQFRIDLKVTPGINYRPGVYTMEIEFIIAPDL